MNAKRFIHDLQKKSYDAKIRLLWTAVGIAAVAIVILWLLTLKFRQRPQEGQTEAPRKLWESLKQVKNLKLNNP